MGSESAWFLHGCVFANSENLCANIFSMGMSRGSKKLLWDSSHESEICIWLCKLVESVELSRWSGFDSKLLWSREIRWRWIIHGVLEINNILIPNTRLCSELVANVITLWLICIHSYVPSQRKNIQIIRIIFLWFEGRKHHPKYNLVESNKYAVHVPFHCQCYKTT